MKFKNNYISDTRRRFFDFLLWTVGYYRDEHHIEVPFDFNYPFPTTPFDESKPWAQWINHSTYLLSLQGRHFLTDPIWGERASPVSFLGPKRKIPPAVAMKDLPVIDYVLISHDHYDHLDNHSVEELHRLYPKILWIVPQGVKRWFTDKQIHNVVELAWWQTIDVGSAFKITSVPSQHFSGRMFFDRTMWAGYVVEDLMEKKQFYFVGDTGYNSYDFKEIGKKWKSFDLSLIPIGAYSPRFFMSPVHVEPKDAVQIHQDVQSKLSLGMHWKTFNLADEPMHEPPYALYLALKEAKLDPATFLPIEPGTKVNW